MALQIKLIDLIKHENNMGADTGGGGWVNAYPRFKILSGTSPRNRDFYIYFFKNLPTFLDFQDFQNKVAEI